MVPLQGPCLAKHQVSIQGGRWSDAAGWEHDFTGVIPLPSHPSMPWPLQGGQWMRTTREVLQPLPGVGLAGERGLGWDPVVKASLQTCQV